MDLLGTVGTWQISEAHATGNATRIAIATRALMIAMAVLSVIGGGVVCRRIGADRTEQRDAPHQGSGASADQRWTGHNPHRPAADLVIRRACNSLLRGLDATDQFPGGPSLRRSSAEMCPGFAQLCRTVGAMACIRGLRLAGDDRGRRDHIGRALDPD